MPPPSKIPSSAVEMPGDAVNSGIGFLDVQFGALEFGSDSSSLDGSANEKYNSANNTIAGVEVSSTTNAVNTANTNNSMDIETTQPSSTTPFNTTSQMVTLLYKYYYLLFFNAYNLLNNSIFTYSYQIATIYRYRVNIR